MAEPVPELTITPCVHIELGGPGPESMKLAPRSELILEFMDWCSRERVLPLTGTSGGHAGHHVAVFDAADYSRIRAWLVEHGFPVGHPRYEPAEVNETVRAVRNEQRRRLGLPTVDHDGREDIDAFIAQGGTTDEP